MTYRKGWRKLLDVGNSGRDVYIASPYYSTFKELEKLQKTNYHLTELYRAIYLLNADALRGKGLSRAGDIRKYSINAETAIEYYIDSGDVLISKLYYDENIGVAGDQTTGLYETRFDSARDLWLTHEAQTGSMKTNHKWNKAHYAAVAGKFDTKSEAGNLLADHILQSYGKKEQQFLPDNAKSQGNHYSLYWIQKGEHQDKPTVNELTSLIQQNAEKSAAVHWLIHGEGAKTFVDAAETLKLKPSLGMMQKADDIKQAELSIAMKQQQVFFSNPVGLTEGKLKKACEQIGVEFKGVNMNPRHISHLSRSVAKELSEKAATYTVLGAGGGSILASETALKSVLKMAEPIANNFSSFASNPTAAGAAMIGATLVATFFAGKKSLTKMNGLFNIAHATFLTNCKNGNQIWYEDDKGLIEHFKPAKTA